MDIDYKDQRIPLEFEHAGKTYTGKAIPLRPQDEDGFFHELDVTLNNESYGTIWSDSNLKWILKGREDQAMAEKIGDLIMLWHQ